MKSKEVIRYCNNCSNLGLDFKTGKFYCGLSNRKDELPEILSCENFSSNCYIKRLQKENEELKKLKDMYFTFYKAKHDDIKGIFFKYKQALEEIREIIKTLIIEMPEYHDCYYKDECGDNCTPKQQGKVAYCCFENVEKIEKLINEVLK